MGRKMENELESSQHSSQLDQFMKLEKEFGKLGSNSHIKDENDNGFFSNNNPKIEKDLLSSQFGSEFHQSQMEKPPVQNKFTWNENNIEKDSSQTESEFDQFSDSEMSG